MVPPCRHFTPSLVEFRDKNKKDFEVVFVSSDRSSKDQLAYMKKYKMKWYTIPHGSDAAKSLSKKYEVRGIPSLVIVNEKGETITKNGRGDVSKNPKGAVSDWKKIRNFISMEFSSAHAEDLSLSLFSLNDNDGFLCNRWRDRGTSNGFSTK